MDWLSGISGLIVTLGGGGGILAFGTAIWKAAKSAAKNEVLADQAQTTIAEKDKENERLWRMLDYLTRPEGMS